MRRRAQSIVCAVAIFFLWTAHASAGEEDFEKALLSAKTPPEQRVFAERCDADCVNRLGAMTGTHAEAVFNVARFLPEREKWILMLRLCDVLPFSDPLSVLSRKALRKEPKALAAAYERYLKRHAKDREGKVAILQEMASHALLESSAVRRYVEDFSLPLTPGDRAFVATYRRAVSATVEKADREKIGGYLALLAEVSKYGCIENNAIDEEILSALGRKDLHAVEIYSRCGEDIAALPACSGACFFAVLNARFKMAARRKDRKAMKENVDLWLEAVSDADREKRENLPSLFEIIAKNPVRNTAIERSVCAYAENKDLFVDAAEALCALGSPCCQKACLSVIGGSSDAKLRKIAFSHMSAWKENLTFEELKAIASFKLEGREAQMLFAYFSERCDNASFKAFTDWAETFDVSDPYSLNLAASALIASEESPRMNRDFIVRMCAKIDVRNPLSLTCLRITEKKFNDKALRTIAEGLRKQFEGMGM